jgi:regulator of PEP synthase PpsR (kinase-PPPase family)
VPGAALPPELDQPPCPVVGLTIDPVSLLDIRKHRLKIIGASGVRVGENDYVDAEAVKTEILSAKRLCAARGWPVIDVTRRSIEETAATVMQQMDLWHQRQGAQRPATPEDPAATVIGAR